MFNDDEFEVQESDYLICQITVRDADTGLSNTSARFTLKYNENMIPKTYPGTINTSFENGVTSTQFLVVNISEINELKDNVSDPRISINITDLEIRFHIEDINGQVNSSSWHKFEDIEYPDRAKPIFYEEEFRPKSGWISSNTPTCSIYVIDTGKGLNISSAKFILEYERSDESGTKTGNFSAYITAADGTTSKTRIYAYISDLDFSEHISDLHRIRFYIKDKETPSNSNLSQWHYFEVDDEKPYSEITNADDIGSEINTSSVKIEADAWDNISSIDFVAIYYKTILGNEWNLYIPEDFDEPYGWDFSVDSGEYVLCTIATDLASNQEDFPDEADVTFVFDPINPYAPTFQNIYRFSSIPEFTIQFQDDYKLTTIEYRLSFREKSDWRIIKDNIQTKSYTASWNLSQDDWDQMLEDDNNYMYFRITDSLGNHFTTTSTSSALLFIKDLDYSPPDNETIGYTPDLSTFDSWNWNNLYEINVDVYDEIQDISLFYSFSTDNETWGNWE